MELLLRLIALGHITPDDALSVLEAQRASRAPIGKMALEAGTLDVNQIFQILARSADTTERFGEAAIALGLLTREQLAVLLLEQQRAETPITDLLIELEFCDSETLARL